MSIKRPGFPFVSIKLFEDYDAILEDRFLELSSTFLSLTMRDGIMGVNEALVQFYDNKNLHALLDGSQLVQVSVKTDAYPASFNRVYATKAISVGIDEKGDNILVLHLIPYHIWANIRFSRKFYSNAGDSIRTMLDVIYKDKEAIKPTMLLDNVYVPNVPWVMNVEDYFQFVREVGTSIDEGLGVYVYEDFTGINLYHSNFIINNPNNVRQFIYGDPKLVGEFVNEVKRPLMYDFRWDSRTNSYTRKQFDNCTFYTHSFNDKSISKLEIGDGTSSVLLSRSGGYSNMIYRNGVEESQRLFETAQYDVYASGSTLGDMSLLPGYPVRVQDHKNQFNADFIIDQVVHEISNNYSKTTLYMYGKSTLIKPEVEYEGVINELRREDFIKSEEIRIPGANDVRADS